MKKIAVCFNGLVGSTKGKSHQLVGNFNKCFNISSALYKKHILDKNDVDVFVHSWSTGMQDHILGAYEPKKYLIEEQKVFSVPKWVPGVKARKQTHYSLWHSRAQSVALKTQYEKENNFKYDYVMMARFDLAWQTDLIFADYDPEYFWTGMWPKAIKSGRMLKDIEYWRNRDKGIKMKRKWWGYPHNDHGLIGTWFFSNSDNMNKFATLHEHLDEYSKVGNCPMDTSGNISAHRQSLYHIEQIGLKDKLRFCDKNWHDDFGTVRRRYFKEK